MLPRMIKGVGEGFKGSDGAPLPRAESVFLCTSIKCLARSYAHDLKAKSTGVNPSL